MTILLWYFPILFLVLYIWHRVQSDQKRLKDKVFCTVCNSILEKRSGELHCPECCVPKWVMTPQEKELFERKQASLERDSVS